MNRPGEYKTGSSHDFQHCRTLWILILLLLGAFPQSGSGQELSLNGFWKFRIGDSIEWNSWKYIDTDWKEIPAGIGWEEVDENVDGFAWYRLKILIPSSLRKSGTGQIELYINRINDADQTFLNGELIGQTDNPYQPDLGPSSVQRRYLVPASLVRWDEENLLAIRVFNSKNYGGIFSGPVLIRPLPNQYFRKTNEVLKVTCKVPAQAAINSLSEASIYIQNVTQVAVQGVFHVIQAEDIFKPVQQDSLVLDIKPGATREYKFPLYTAHGGLLRLFGMLVSNDGTEHVFHSGSFVVKPKLPSETQEYFQGALNGQVEALVEDKVKSLFKAPAFEEQHFEGYLGWRMQVNLEKRLLSTDTAFLMKKFLRRGYLSDGKPYDGEHLGKYFNAACNTWLLTHSEPLKLQMDALMTRWLTCQLPDGYLGTYLPGEYWDDWDVWVHKYDLIGLLSYYKAFRDERALAASRKIGDLLLRTFGDDKPGKRKLEKTGRHYGMASLSVLDPMAELYRLTADTNFLSFCKYIIRAIEGEAGPRFFSSLMQTESVKKTANAKAYEMISCFSAMVKLYRITGDERLLQPVMAGWSDIVNHRLFITGSCSHDEKFQEDDHYELSPEFEPSEGCVTTSWMQLNMQLYYTTGDPVYLSLCENTLYNQLLAAQNVKTGCVSYFTPAQEAKYPSCAVTCCLSSITRGISSIPEIVWGNYGSGIAINLFNPGSFSTQLTNRGKIVHLQVQCKGDFPASGELSYELHPEVPLEFPVYLRVPAWCKGFKATVKSTSYNGIPGTYLEIRRKWNTNDSIHVSMTLPEMVIPGRFFSYPDAVALVRGPQVLASDKNFSAYSPFHPLGKQPVPLLLEAEKAEKPVNKNWLGPWIYRSGWYFRGTHERLVLVPFAEAGENDKMFAIWLYR